MVSETFAKRSCQHSLGSGQPLLTSANEKHAGKIDRNVHAAVGQQELRITHQTKCLLMIEETTILFRIQHLQ